MRSECTSTMVAALVLLTASGSSLANEALRDPTRPYTVVRAIEAPPPRFRVNAIIVSDARRIAIVNGKRVGVGGTVDGATVVAIAKGNLVLEVDGKEMTLTLNSRSSRP